MKILSFFISYSYEIAPIFVSFSLNGDCSKIVNAFVLFFFSLEIFTEVKKIIFGYLRIHQAMAGIIDIEDIVKDYAWNIQTTSGNGEIDFDEARFDINWSRTKFVSSNPEFEVINDNTSWKQNPKGKSAAKFGEESKAQVIYQSTYVNKTNGEHEQNISMQRSTKNICKAFVTKGYTKGINVGLKLAVPGDVANLTTSFGYSVNLTDNSEESTEETMTWGSDCKVKVPKGQRMSAKISVTEKEYNATFRMKSTIYGTVHIAIHSRADDRLVRSIDAPFMQIMRWYCQKEGFKDCSIKEKGVEWEINGKCFFRFGVEQTVEIQPV